MRQIGEPKKYHHLAVRLTPTQYVGLERLRVRLGSRSFNATLGRLLDISVEDLDREEAEN